MGSTLNILPFRPLFSLPLEVWKILDLFGPEDYAISMSSECLCPVSMATKIKNEKKGSSSQLLRCLGAEEFLVHLFSQGGWSKDPVSHSGDSHELSNSDSSQAGPAQLLPGTPCSRGAVTPLP